MLSTNLDLKEHQEKHIINGQTCNEDLAFISLLKACAKTRDLCKGMHLHADIVKRGLLQKSPYVGSSLINMYAKCGHFAKATQVLEEIPIRNIASWNAIISGYAHHSRRYQALHCLEYLDCEGFSPNSVTFICILKACGTTPAYEDVGKQIHEKIVKSGFLCKDVLVGNALVDMYAKCGALEKAQQVLEELPIRDVVSWNALIAGYAHEGKGHEALYCFERMQHEALSPDSATFVSILKACGSNGLIIKGKQIHEKIVNCSLLERHSVLGTALVDMYVKCGLLEKSQKVLEGLPLRNTISCSALIAGYTQHGRCHEALNGFEWMQSEGIYPNSVTFILVLRACGKIQALDKGKQIHDEIVQSNLLDKDSLLGHALVDMYIKCGVLSKALSVLEELPIQDAESWNALIARYAEQGQGHVALKCFKQMQIKGFSPDAVTFICVLKACGILGAIEKAKQIHDDIVNRGLLRKDIVLGTALVDTYAKCGVLTKAKQVLEELPARNIVTWNALIAGYAQQGQCQEALNCFEWMQSEGLLPDVSTFTCILKACGQAGDIDKGKLIHEEISSRGLVGKDNMIGTALIDFYAKCSMLGKAQEVLEELQIREIISWNALITGYAQQGQVHKAQKCVEQMKNEGLWPDSVTFICILKACSSTGAIDLGKQIHGEVTSRGLLEKDISLGNALADMYAKCGSLEKAQQVLEELPFRDVVSWSALVAGYAEQGQGQEAVRCLEHMKSEGLSPNRVTFLSVLSACSHGGLLNEAQTLYTNMTGQLNIAPNTEHHMCMVMVFGLAGHFDDAMSVIRVMPSSHYPTLWLALLGACKKWGNVKLGRLTFDQIVQLDNSCSTAYVLISDIFAAAGMHEDVEKINALRQKYATWKKQENNLGVDTSGNVHAFSRKDIQHSLSKTMYTNEKTITCKMTSVMVTVS